MKTKNRKVKRKPVARKPVTPKAFDLALVKKFVEDNLQVNIDYGPLENGTDKILFKSGADKLARFFNVYPETTLVREEKLNAENIDVVTTTKLIDAKTQKPVWNSSLCSCNTLEDEYRFQWVRPVCMTCAGSGSMLTGDICKDCKGNSYSKAPSREEMSEKLESGMGRLVPRMNGSVRVCLEWWERRPRESVSNQWNNVRQQAGKRSFVQAIRSYGCVSKIFTDDVGDWYNARRGVEQMAQSKVPGVQFEEPVKK